jgi:hypothetical protein
MSERHLEDFVASLCMAVVMRPSRRKIAAAQAQLVPAQDASSLLGAQAGPRRSDLEPRSVARTGGLAGPDARIHRPLPCGVKASPGRQPAG